MSVSTAHRVTDKCGAAGKTISGRFSAPAKDESGRPEGLPRGKFYIFPVTAQ